MRGGRGGRAGERRAHAPSTPSLSLLLQGFELAKQAALSFLDTYKVALPSPADREALHCAARCALRTKLAEPMADALASIVADAVLTVRREGEPIDLHMVEVRREERRGGNK